jgi:hypothetical protein
VFEYAKTGQLIKVRDEGWDLKTGQPAEDPKTTKEGLTWTPQGFKTPSTVESRKESLMSEFSLIKVLETLRIIPVDGEAPGELMPMKTFDKDGKQILYDARKAEDKWGEVEHIGVYRREALTAELESQRDKIANVNTLEGSQVLRVITSLLKNKLTWQQFNYLLIVLGVNDIENSLALEIKDTVMVEGSTYPGVNGCYVRQARAIQLQKNATQENPLSNMWKGSDGLGSIPQWEVSRQNRGKAEGNQFCKMAFF